MKLTYHAVDGLLFCCYQLVIINLIIESVCALIKFDRVRRFSNKGPTCCRALSIWRLDHIETGATFPLLYGLLYDCTWGAKREKNVITNCTHWLPCWSKTSKQVKKKLVRFLLFYFIQCDVWVFFFVVCLFFFLLFLFFSTKIPNDTIAIGSKLKWSAMPWLHVMLDVMYRLAQRCKIEHFWYMYVLSVSFEFSMNM